MRIKGTIIFGLCLALTGAAYATKTYGPVKRGDTLWHIAAKHRPDRSVSIHEMLAAIQHMNKVTLAGSNHLSVGQKLTLPSTVQEVRQALNPSAAVPKAPEMPVAAPQSAPTTTSQFVSEPVAPAQPDPQAAMASSDEPVPMTTVHEPAQTAAMPAAEAPLMTASQPSSGFPWSWVWFVAALLAGSYLVWVKLFKKSLPGNFNGMAAARLGISQRRTPPRVTKYKTRRFKEADPQKPQIQTMNNEPYSPESADALAGAMIDMAEDDNGNAEKILKAALSKDATNLEIRMKLLELYVKTNNRDAFKEQADQVEKMVPEHSAMWNTVRSLYLNKWAYD